MTTTKKLKKKKNSLVKNINLKKKSGTSKPKARSTVEEKNYTKMEKGWE